MTTDLADPVTLTQALVRCPSVTPLEAGALDLTQGWLTRLGFTCHRIVGRSPGTVDVDNLYARIGNSAPHLCFAGHVDVVPVGDEAAWTHPPFGGFIEGGYLFGRGVVDMKGNIAAFIAAVAGYLGDAAGARQGSISFLITCDEEGPSVNGTTKVLEWMDANRERPDHALVGEPSNVEVLGDSIKIGRRGSLSGDVIIHGRQGHAAYPNLTRNPVHGLARAIAALTAEPLDDGNERFDRSNLEVVSLIAGNQTYNVVPNQAAAKLNIRFNDTQTTAGLEAKVRTTVERAIAGSGLSAEMSFHSNADAFVTAPGALLGAMETAVEAVTGRRPRHSTGGGTSDARFIKAYCPVIEFGLVNKTLHAVDERTPVADIAQLKGIYRVFLENYFAAFAR